MTTKIKGAAFEHYSPKIFDTIPLHKPFARRTITRKGQSVTIELGKRPLHNAWTRKRYGSKAVIRTCIAEGRNMGIRPRPGQLIIDVDPRNGGDAGFAELCAAVGDDFRPEDYPTVRTGSGGLHVYMTKPEDLAVSDTVEGYPGVEFKTVGRQVLAAGCVHPVTGKRYVFLPGRDINDLPPAPKKLLRLIKQAPRPESTGDGGHIANHRLARALEGLDPCDFGGKDNHERWFQAMCAAHHATDGAGREEFIAWSTSDPAYADHADEIGRRWDSLHAERAEGKKLATIKSLNRFLVKAGRKDLLLPTESAADAFAKDPIPFKDEDPIPEETLRYLAEQFPDDVKA